MGYNICNSNSKEGDMMKIFKTVIIGGIIFVIIKAFNIFENAGAEMDPNGNVIAFGFLVGFFGFLILAILFSGIGKKENKPIPMATRKRR